MRKFSLLLCALFLVTIGYAEVGQDKPTTSIPVEIPIKGSGGETETETPRPLSLRSDIEASYFNGALTVVFNADLGDADIVVSNLTTSEMWSDSVSGVGATTLLLSGEEGYYEILIYTDCGEYTGEFEI